jgi:hypothetical protein
MPVQQNDSPQIKLQLQADGLKATWGPSQGPWGIFAKNTAPKNVTVKEWWLFVGTKPNPGQSDEASQCEIVSQSVGTQTEITIPRDLLPLNKQVQAQVVGFFDSQNEHGEPIVEGIYSDVTRQVIK